MFPYFLLLVVPVLFYRVQFSKKKILINLRSNICDEDSFALPSFFVVLALLLIFRDESIGRDLHNYKYMFNQYGQMTWYYLFQNYFNFTGQIGFRVFSKLLYSVCKSYNFYLAIVALLCVIPIASFYCEDRTYPLLKIVIFLNMSTFVILFSTLRQSIAVSIGLIAYDKVKKDQEFHFYLWCIIAFLFHHSAFMLLPMYWLYHMRIKTKHFLIVIPLFLVVFVFNKQIFSIVSSFLGNIFGKYESESYSTNAYGTLSLFMLFSIASFIIPDEKFLGAEEIGLRNLLLFTTFLQVFALLHNLAMRLNYYYIIIIPVAIGKLLSYPKEKYRQVTKAIVLVISVSFSFLYARTVYNGSITGKSALDIYPYIPFWRH